MQSRDMPNLKDSVPLHVGVASRYLEARKLSGPIRSAGATLASNISSWLLKEGPERLDWLNNYPQMFGDIIPRATLNRVAATLTDAGLPVNVHMLASLKLQLLYTANSYFSPQERIIAISKPYSLSGWGDWLKRGGEFERAFVHEFTHAVDFLRGPGQKAYSPTIKDDMSKYITHPLEVNARIQELMLKYDRKLDKVMGPLLIKKDTMDPEDLEWELESYIGETPKYEVVDLLHEMDRRLLQHMDSDLRKRLLKRLYTEVEESKERWRTLMDFKIR